MRRCGIGEPAANCSRSPRLDVPPTPGDAGYRQVDNSFAHPGMNSNVCTN
ncbi:hypothetical protein HMPREF3150_00749 [Pseudomonas aeruginosa]|nr:hypothetical protein HMPREF3150_00749 [Pseudomonas aeruginosa]